MGCLYEIKFPSGKSYIGVTRYTAAARFRQHAALATRGEHVLSVALRKYGAENCSVRTLVIADDVGYLKQLEVRAIAAFGTLRPGGYNSTAGGDGVRDPSGEAHRLAASRSKATRSTPEFRKAVSEHQKAVWDCPEKKAVRSEMVRGLWKDPAYAENMRQRHRGVVQSEGQRQKTSDRSTALWKDPAHRQKMSAGMTEQWADPTCRAQRMSGMAASAHLISATSKARWSDHAYREKVTRAQQEHIAKPGVREAIAATQARIMEDPAARIRIALSLFKWGDAALVKAGECPFRADSAARPLWAQAPSSARVSDLLISGFTTRQIKSAILRGAWKVIGEDKTA